MQLYRFQEKLCSEPVARSDGQDLKSSLMTCRERTAAENCFAFERSDHAGGWTQPVQLSRANYLQANERIPDRDRPDDEILDPVRNREAWLDRQTRLFGCRNAPRDAGRWPVFGSMLPHN
jgi:hypothetical protein